MTAARKDELQALFEFRNSIEQARKVLKDEKMMDMQSHVLSIATAFYNQRMTAKRNSAEKQRAVRGRR